MSHLSDSLVGSNRNKGGNDFTEDLISFLKLVIFQKVHIIHRHTNTQQEFGLFVFAQFFFKQFGLL